MTPQPWSSPWSTPWSTRLARPLVPGLIIALLMSSAAPLAWGQDRGHDRGHGHGWAERGQDHHGPERGQKHNGPERGQKYNGPERGHGAPAYRAPVVVVPAPSRGVAPRWVDTAHGHRHAYPPAGWVVNTPPPRARRVVWAGVPYWYDTGVWYGHGPRGYVVLRPPRGAVVFDLPNFRTVVLVAGLAYLYANGSYYLERPQGGYEVVDAPRTAVGARGLLMENGNNAPPSDRVFVYPRQGQSAQQQASDEFDCHRWARNQTGFDPSATAVGQAAPGSASQRGDYERAHGACLDARGYTVR